LTEMVDAGRAEGQLEGLRRGIEALCEVLGIELSAERREQMNGLCAAELTALLGRLRTERRWSSAG